MARTKAVVVGSGAGGAVAAMVLAQAGNEVVILEKGDSWFADLRQASPRSSFANDELKGLRYFALPDPITEPRTYRWHPTDAKPKFVGAFQPMPQTAGGATVHWDAKTPRMWDIDFAKLSMLGPIPGAQIVDWPFTYQDLVPYYERVEALIGVSGDIHQLPATTLARAPRTNPLPMPPGPPQYSSLVIARGAQAIGLHPFPTPMAIASQAYDGRPACNNCGFCSSFGCPINARVGALAPLRVALQHGAELRTRAWATRVNVRGSKAASVTWQDENGHDHTEAADVVVLACQAIESVRLALLSQLPNPNGTVGQCFMMHWFTDATGVFLGERLHAHRGRSTSHDVDDFADPDFPGARAAAKAAGLPYFRGGTIEIGGSQEPIGEAGTYRLLLSTVAPDKPFGTDFKELMRSSVLRDRLAGMQMHGEDLPYPTNAVDLDPTVKDFRGLPVARITYSPGPHEIAAQNFYKPYLNEMVKRAGADASTAVADTQSDQTPLAGSLTPTTAHIMGGMRMGTDEKISVTDGTGRYHWLDNLFVADGGVFPSAGGHNPTLTIMAAAWRNAQHWH